MSESFKAPSVTESDLCFVVTSAPLTQAPAKLLPRFLSSSDIAQLKDHIAGFPEPKWSHSHSGVVEKRGINAC